MLQVINPFVPKAPLLYPLKTSENLTVFCCFQGLEKGCIGNERVNVALLVTHIYNFPWQYFQNVSHKQTLSSNMITFPLKCLKVLDFWNVMHSSGKTSVTGTCFSRTPIRLQSETYSEPSQKSTMKIFRK